MHQLQEYFYNQFPIIEQNNLIVIITALVIALLYVFFGYKLLRVYISLLGFLIGFALGIVICAVFDLSNTTAVIVIICVCAVALAALGFWLYKAGLFVMILSSCRSSANSRPFSRSLCGSVRSCSLLCSQFWQYSS